MHKSSLTALFLLSAFNARAQPCPTGETCSVSPPPGKGNSGIARPADSFGAECLANLVDLASQQLKVQLQKDKAVNKQVLATAKITEAELGANCAKVCGDYGYVSNKISWAHVSPGFLSEPEHTQQKIFGAMPQPQLPGKAELQACLPPYVTANWCPKSGSGVGAGPARIENPLDKIKVCISGADALSQMNFSALDASHNCARPDIVNADERIKTEHQCVVDATPKPKILPAAVSGPIGRKS